MAYAVGDNHYLVDIHVHGAENYDTRTRRQDDILQIAAVHGAHGTSAILPTIGAGAIGAMRDSMAAVRRAMEAQQEGARILGVHLEGPFLNPVQAGALDAPSFLPPSLDDLERLIEGFEDIVRIVTLAPELPGALAVIERCRQKGILVQMGHSDASFEQADEGKRAGATGITHLFNAMRGFHHREPGLAGFGLMDDDLYVEIIADLAHLHPQSLKMVFDMKSPGKIILISDSVRGPNWGKGPIRGPDGALLGCGIAQPDAIRNLTSIGVPLERAFQFASDNPIKYLGLGSPGQP